MLCALLPVLFCAMAHAAEKKWVRLPEPAFMYHKVKQEIPGAKSTVLAAAYLGAYGPEFPTAEEWKDAAIAEEALTASTQAAATEWLKQLKPEYTRNASKVVEYARLSSEKVLVSATVFSPEFLKMFEDVFGPKPLVVIPNRHTVFVFPGLAGKHDRFAPMVLRAWKSGLPRVSLEVFEVSPQGLRAVGVFEE